jgi:hypothetical protein
MALSILDGNQSATTLSTILSSGQHITAHTVISLGTQAITDIANATSANLTNTQLRASAVTVGGTVTVGNSLTISSLPAISGTVTANLGNVAGTPLDNPPSHAVRIAWADEDTLRGAGVDNGGEPLPIQIYLGNSSADNVTTANPLPISGTVTIGSALPAGTNRIGVVTIGAGTVTIGAGTAQIGSVTVGNSVTIGSLPAISGTVTAAITVRDINNLPNAVGVNFKLPVAISNIESSLGGVEYVAALQDGNGLVFGADRSFPVSGSVTIGAGIAQIGSVTASISNSVTIGSLPAISGTVTANTFALQGTAVTTSNFTSTTASTVLANYNATREVLTIFNEGAGNLHIAPGATCTTIAYQVRLSAGDYYEVPNHQTTITHSAVFATAGTARVTQVS